MVELRKMVAQGKKSAAIQARKNEMLGQVYHMLSLTLGEPVKEFTYAFRDKDGKQVGEAKKYTPKSFYEETVGKDLNGTFLMVMNMIAYTTSLYLGTSRCLYKFADITMESFQIIFTDLGAR